MTLEELASKAHQVIRTYPVAIADAEKRDWYFLKLQEEVGELTQAYLKHTGRARVRGESAEALKDKFSDELADVLGFVLVLAHEHGIDLEGTFRKKWVSLLQERSDATTIA